MKWSGAEKFEFTDFLVGVFKVVLNCEQENTRLLC